MGGISALFFVSIMMMTVSIIQVTALDTGEVTALKDMQAEWGTQLGWTGAPSCQWKGVTCDSSGHVTRLYVAHFSAFILLI